MDKYFINDRFKIIKNMLFDGNAAELARQLGCSRETISSIVKNKAEVSKPMRQKAIDKLNINPKWLDYGDEPMILSDSVKSATASNVVDVVQYEVNSYKLMKPFEDYKVSELKEIDKWYELNKSRIKHLVSEGV